MRNCLACLLLFSALFASTCAMSPAENVRDEQALDSLELRAAKAPPRDQCYLYAELIKDSVEYSVRQYASGNSEKAASNLRRTQKLAHMFRTMLTGNVKKLKRAQSMLRRAAFRLTDLLHASHYEDRPLVKDTLAEVDRAEQAALTQMFKE
ncbi:MAG TPA: hypothetical protein VGR47_00285 [Terracidiphilus sp.]|nr:hypothetical protein [Terracidiphilus sp.]